MKLLVTGSNGFVGHHLCPKLLEHGYFLNKALRTPSQEMNSFQKRYISVGSINKNTDWSDALDGCDAVIHLAARVHVMNETSQAPLAAFREVNVNGTVELAQQAADAGIKRFIFVSTAKVNGEWTNGRRPFAPGDAPDPQDFYSISKMEAEQGLQEIARTTGMAVVIVRPPLVYGPHVKANFAAMIRWLSQGIPLPLGAVTDNRRSLVSLDNLADFLITCLEHPEAANHTFMVSDGEDLSTTALLQRLGKAMGTAPLLLPIPPVILEAGATLLGKGDMAQRLLNSLEVDISKNAALLGWQPPFSVDEGLEKTAKTFF